MNRFHPCHAATPTGRRAGLLFAMAAAVCCGTAWAGPERWTADPDTAFEAAREHGRPILALFTGSDWCPHCQLLEEHVLATDAFEAWASGRVELLMIDLPRQGISQAERDKRSALCRRYGVKSFPNVVLIAPDGSRIASQPGYGRQPADAWIATVDRKLSSWTTASAAPADPKAAEAGRVAREAVRDAVREAETAKRPVLLVVSRSTDQDGRIRAASLVNDPEFRSFTKDTFVVAEVAADDEPAAEAAAAQGEPLRSLLGGVTLPSDEVELIVTYDGRTPMYTQSARQPVSRLISGLRRFLGARPGSVRR